MACVATLTRGGRITLPKRLRALMGVEAGDEVMFVLLHNGNVILRVRRAASKMSA